MEIFSVAAAIYLIGVPVTYGLQHREYRQPTEIEREHRRYASVIVALVWPVLMMVTFLTWAAARRRVPHIRE